jgi:hypothetical protein
VIGIEAQQIRHGGPSARFGPILTRIVEKFLLEDQKFLQWKSRQNFRVTMTTLLGFDLDDLRLLIGAGNLDNFCNVDERPILPILDEKIRRKMAYVYKQLSEKDKAIGAHISSPYFYSANGRECQFYSYHPVINEE